MSKQENYTIVIATRDSGRWVGDFVRAYRSLGVEPLYLYDTRSKDDTSSELSRVGAHVIPISPSHNRVESLLRHFVDAVSSEWVIRFDDDELPSSQLINWLNSSLDDITHRSLAISRRDSKFIGGELKYSRLEDYYFCERDYTFLDPQWRAFRPADVQLDDRIHSAGFVVADSDWSLVPAKAFFVHFDWIVRSFNERMEKLRTYELQSPGAGWGMAQFYLPELHAEEDARWTSFEDRQFDRFAEKLRKISASAS